MTEQRKGDLGTGAGVRMKGTGRTGTIREIVETPDQTVYYVVQDTIGTPATEFGTYCTTDGFDMLLS